MSDDSIKKLWPKGEMPCIWMQAGLVELKLCRHQGNCDDCPFDWAMRGQPFEAKPVKNNENILSAGFQKKISSIDNKPITISEKNLYHEPCWFINKTDRFIMLGLDSMFVDLLPEIKDVVFPPAGSVIRKNQVLSWLLTKHGAIILKSPVQGRIISLNNKIVESFKNKKQGPEKDFSLMSLESGDKDSISSFISGDTAKHYLFSRKERFLSSFRNRLLDRHPEVGETMQDGGELVDSYEKILGPKEYLDLLNQEFFGKSLT